jgi:hypothetical protein
MMNGVVQKRLMLPDGTPYVDAYPGMSMEEAIEEVVVFDDVYPHRVGDKVNLINLCRPFQFYFRNISFLCIEGENEDENIDCRR